MGCLFICYHQFGDSLPFFFFSVIGVETKFITIEHLIKKIPLKAKQLP